MVKIKVVKMCLAMSIIGSLFSLTANAQSETAAAKGKDRLIKEADAVIKKHAKKGDREKELQKLGWEPVAQEQQTPTQEGQSLIAPLSSSTCGTLNNQNVLKHWDGTTGRYVYLMQTTWDFKESCNWDSSSGSANDYLGMAIVDAQGNSAATQAEYAQIYAYDEDGDSHNVASVNDYHQAGVSFRIEDRYSFPDNIGENGTAWFYASKPTSGGENFYLRGKWIHNWSSAVASISGIKVSYPFSVEATFSPADSVQGWPAPSQTYITMN